MQLRRDVAVSNGVTVGPLGLNSKIPLDILNNNNNNEEEKKRSLP